MRRPIVFAAIFALSGFMAACAMNPQNIVIDPNPEMLAYNVGNRQSLAIDVVDKRPSSLIGYKKDETKESAPLRSGNDVAAAVLEKVKETVTDHGFTLSTGSYPDARLTVEVTAITYKSSGKYVAPKATTSASFRAVAVRGATTYSQSYSIENETVEALPLTEERNERIINDTVSQALGMMVEDKGLWQFLATGVVPSGAR